jgi:hypothetical protein
MSGEPVSMRCAVAIIGGASLSIWGVVGWVLFGFL